jgi:large subunit ribosomal protein L22
LQFSHRRISGEVKKLLESAIANAENNHQLDVDRLFVAEASVGKDILMKRWRARARGRVGRIVKPFSNMRLVVREREETA